MRKRPRNAWRLGLVLSILGAFVCPGAQAQIAVRCGLNPVAPTDPRKILAHSEARSSRAADREVFNIVSEETRRDRTLMDRGFNLPNMWSTDGGKNVVIVRGQKLPEDPADVGPFTVVLLDEDWLQGIGRTAGTSWTRTWALAHELGHLFHGHLDRGGSTRDEAEEEAADHFAGRALARLGASLVDAQSFLTVVEPKSAGRLAAIRRGWLEGAKTNQSRRVRSRDFAIMIGGTVGAGTQVELDVGGHLYTLSTGTKLRIPVTAPAISMKYRTPNEDWASIQVEAGLTYWVHWIDQERGYVVASNAPTIPMRPEGWARMRRRLGLL